MYAENTRRASTGGASGAIEFTRFVWRCSRSVVATSVEARSAEVLHPRLPRHGECVSGLARAPRQVFVKERRRSEGHEKTRRSGAAEPFGEGQCRSDKMRMQNANASLAVLVRMERANASRVQLLPPGLQVEHTRIMKRSASAGVGSVWQQVESGSLSRGRSNPSIEGTCNIWLPQLSPAPHVKR